jgi:hypothetical protein
VARQICERAQATAVIESSISKVGNSYKLVLDAVNCATGETVATSNATAQDKDHVLAELDGASSELRGKLGESLASIQKYNTPIEQATTSSLDALKAYSEAVTLRPAHGDAAAQPLLQTAVDIDPNFAMARAVLGQVQMNLGEREIGWQNIQRAYEMRDRASERERFYIDSHYQDEVKHNIDKSLAIYRQWSQAYPRDAIALESAGAAEGYLGNLDESLSYMQKARDVAPDDSNINEGLAVVYVFSERFDEARATVKEAASRNLNAPGFQLALYMADFLQNDEVAMRKDLIAYAAGGYPYDAYALSNEAYTDAYHGQMRKALDANERSIKTILAHDEMQIAADDFSFMALTKALVGDGAGAKHDAQTGLSMGCSEDGKSFAAVALGLSGDTGKAESLANELERANPENTLILGYQVPAIRASVELARKNPKKAIEALVPALRYDYANQLDMLAAFLRGQAYIADRNGVAAAREFQKIINHPAIPSNYVTGSLARLGLGRAYALQGETAKARLAYEDFFALWKDADPDVPVLVQAKAEYAKLK